LILLLSFAFTDEHCHDQPVDGKREKGLRRNSAFIICLGFIIFYTYAV
jgi:hypothetical protein